jgi:sulfur carrier protein ThiS adenylyltransferase
MAANPYLNAGEKEILENARIGIAGAGGLGSNCAMHLVRAGVRRLVIVDFDVVAAGNLNRQFFFADQVGRPKVEALRENLLRIEPDLELEIHNIRLTPDNIHGIFARCPIVAEAFDRADAKQMLLSSLLPGDKQIVSVSGLGGWGKSNDIRARRLGRNLVLVGDGRTGTDPVNGPFPISPRVGIAASMQANSIAALLLGLEI